jgi:hypothetical protein
MEQEAVLHFRDGQTLRCGLSELPHEDSSSVRTRSGENEHDVPVEQLKAIFFVRDEPMNALGAEPEDLKAALTVEFADGEVIRGRAGHYNPAKAGFYLFPADRSKNERIFVVSSAIVSIDAESV